MSKQNFLHLKPHLVLGEAKVGSNWVNYQRASPREHLLNRLPQAHTTRQRMQLSFGGAKIWTPSFEPGFHPVIQFLKLAWKSQCFRNISVDCWSVFCQASAQKFPRGHIVYWNYISISKHNWEPIINDLVQFEEDFNSRTEMWWWSGGVGWGYLRPDQFLDHLTVI